MQEHKDILKLLQEKNFQNVILVGEIFSKACAEEQKSNVLLFETTEELAEKLKAEINISNALVLIKGSRGIRLEKVVEFL
jgi:UDP-N-acetylmuramoyl-tripeptide--D-alanyl-D-alanine ligase